MAETTASLRPGAAALATRQDEQRAKIVADVESAITTGGRLDRAPATTGASARSRTGSTTSPTPSITCSSSTAPPALIESLSHDLRITDGVVRFRVIKNLPGTPPAPDSPPPVVATRRSARASAAASGAAGLSRRRRRRVGARGQSPPPRGPRPQCRLFATGLRRLTTARTEALQRCLSIFRGQRMLPSGARLDSATGFQTCSGKEPRAMNINRVVAHREPHEGSRHALDCRRRGCRSASCGSRSTPAARTTPAGNWEEKPNYFDVTVFGRQAESCGQYLHKGRPVAIDGRLDWREYEVEGQKRQSVDIIAENVQFLGGREDAGNGNGNGYSSGVRAAESDIPADTSDFETAPVAAGAVRRRHSVLGNRLRLRQQPSR